MIIPSMARTRRYMHGKRRRQCPASPFKHDHDREFSKQGKEFLASQKRHEENIASGRVVTQPISSYIENVKADMDRLARLGKVDTPEYRILDMKHTRLLGMQNKQLAESDE